MNNEQSRPNVLADKSYAFALRIVRLSKYLRTSHKEYVLSAQILGSGTAIGALIREGAYAQSKADFINKMSIALEEANETDYWLNILKDTDFIELKIFNSMIKDCTELVRMLIATIKTSKGI